MPARPRVLLLSAYDADSHRQWRENLARLFPAVDWTQLSLPARHFSWRVRGNALTWRFENAALLRRPYDLLIATSMVDLASLRGFLPGLAGIPTVVYFHENQFAYPPNALDSEDNRQTRVNAQLISLYAALCADRIVFNSDYNRQTFLAGAGNLLSRLPERTPDVVMETLGSALVVPVPLAEDARQTQARGGPDRHVLDVVWNHRWEFDKGPELLLETARGILRDDLPVRLHMLGRRFRRAPAEFAQLTEILAETGARHPGLAGRIGYIPERQAYLEQLARCDVVLSTARHDFFGISVLEACSLGCTPLCPDALVYPDYLEKEFLYPWEEGGEPGCCAEEILARLRCWAARKADGQPLPSADISCFDAGRVRARYAELFAGLGIRA